MSEFISDIGEETPKVDKHGFTIKPPMCDNEVIIRCLKNAPCGIDRKQAERLIKHYENQD